MVYFATKLKLITQIERLEMFFLYFCDQFIIQTCRSKFIKSLFINEFVKLIKN